MEKQGKELYLRLFSANICDLFEDLLDKHDMTIPSEDREGEEDEARIYGDVYYDLEARVTELLAGLCEEVKAAPDIAINIEDYNGFEGGSNNKGTYASWKEYSLSKHECDNLVEVMVANIRGMGIDEGSGYFGLKSFGLNEDRFNLYCEVSKEQEDGDISFVVYYALEFDEGDNLWSEWAHTETLDIDELKSIIFDIASADCTKDVQTYFENLPKVKVDNKNGFEDENTQSDKTTVNKKALSYAEQAELFIKENPAVAWEISMLIDRENHREDIIGKLEEHGFSDIPDADIENLVDEFERALSKNDGYYEAFWSSADYVIDEYCMSFEDISPALPESIKITAATLALDTDDIYRDEEAMSDILSDYLSDEYGFCHKGFDYEVHYNEFNEPSEVIVSNIQWDVDEVLDESNAIVFERHVLTRLTEKGFDISQIDLEINDFIDNDHKDCSWYGGVVAEVKYKDFLFSLEARGDIVCTLLDKKDNELGYVKDRNNGRSFRYEMAHCLANDTELYKAKDEGLLVFENNNWFEIFVRTPDMEWQQATWLTNSDDLEECVFEMIETMDEMIEELDESKQIKIQADKSLNDIVADATERSTANQPNKELNTELTK